MTEIWIRFSGDESGATAIEYALVASGIGMAIVTVIGQISGALTSLFTTVNSGFD